MMNPRSTGAHIGVMVEGLLEIADRIVASTPST
jgi:hypothetical protein